MGWRHTIVLTAALLASIQRPAAAEAPPTAAMFRSQTTVLEAGALSLQSLIDGACRRWASASGGVRFFSAWAFPTTEPVHSCHRRRFGNDDGSQTVAVREGRIVVNPERDDGLTISDGRTKDSGPHWGVLLFLHQEERGACRVRDVKLLAPDRSFDLGNERLAWLGAVPEARGLEFIRGLLGGASDRHVRKHLAFALYLFAGSEAVSDLVRLARRDADASVRKDAIFWLGQKASAAAVQALGDVVASPESLEIKKHAVFALSQLDGDRGTPLLLEIARRNPYPALRKEAIFWLGESGDPRALEFFEEILLR